MSPKPYVASVISASQALSMAGFEEASRFGRTSADLEDLLVALVRDSGVGGQALRSAGAQLQNIRDAIATTHAEGLRGLGIDAELPGRTPARPELMEKTSWTPRAQAIFQKARAQDDFSLSVLETLLAEPSGVITEVLTQAGITDAELQTAVESHRTTAPARAKQKPHLTATRDTVIAAPAAEVWQWLGKVENVRRWSAVGEDITETESPDAWLASGRVILADGKEIRTKAHTQRRLLTRTDADSPVLIEWTLSYPDNAKLNAQVIHVELHPVAETTRAVVTVSWTNKSPRRFRPLAWLLRPLTRAMVGLQAFQIGNAISSEFADR